jgi:hypothetical protein
VQAAMMRESGPIAAALAIFITALVLSHIGAI